MKVTLDQLENALKHLDTTQPMAPAFPTSPSLQLVDVPPQTPPPVTDDDNRGLALTLPPGYMPPAAQAAPPPSARMGSTKAFEYVVDHEDYCYEPFPGSWAPDFPS